jgi:hypothetical protein
MPKTRKQRGGSAWSWGLTTAGDGWTQFMNSLSVNNPTNNLVLANKSMKGGKRRRKRSVKKGGNIGAVISQAAAPLTLFAMQHLASRKRKSGRH